MSNKYDVSGVISYIESLALEHDELLAELEGLRLSSPPDNLQWPRWYSAAKVRIGDYYIDVDDEPQLCKVEDVSFSQDPEGRDRVIVSTDHGSVVLYGDTMPWYCLPTEGSL